MNVRRLSCEDPSRSSRRFDGDGSTPQAFILGRYCSHFHEAFSLEGGYVKDNSIHHSFQRGTTVHATYFVEVAHNVAYDVRGHTFFVEDGNEKYNTFDGNLAVSTRCSAVRVTQLALGSGNQGLCALEWNYCICFLEWSYWTCLWNYCIDFLAAFASWSGIAAFVSWSGIAAFVSWSGIAFVSWSGIAAFLFWCSTVNNSHFSALTTAGAAGRGLAPGRVLERLAHELLEEQRRDGLVCLWVLVRVSS